MPSGTSFNSIDIPQAASPGLARRRSGGSRRTAQASSRPKKAHSGLIAAMLWGTYASRRSSGGRGRGRALRVPSRAQRRGGGLALLALPPRRVVPQRQLQRGPQQLRLILLCGFARFRAQGCEPERAMVGRQ